MRPRSRPSEAITFLLGHLLVGVLAAVSFLGLLLVTDLFGLRSLAFGHEAGWLAILMLLFGFVITFGSIAMGMGVYSQGDGPGVGRGRRLFARLLSVWSRESLGAQAAAPVPAGAPMKDDRRV